MGLAEKRKPLNSPFIKLDKKNPVLKGVYMGHYDKMCLDVDMETGEVNTDADGNEIKKAVRVLKFETLEGFPVSMFETGGLKANREIIELEGPKGIEIVWQGKKELGGVKNVNEYLIYPLDVSTAPGLTQETASETKKGKKHA